jgi:hypothetical protein
LALDLAFIFRLGYISSFLDRWKALFFQCFADQKIEEKDFVPGSIMGVRFGGFVFVEVRRYLFASAETKRRTGPTLFLVIFLHF